VLIVHPEVADAPGVLSVALAASEQMQGHDAVLLEVHGRAR
jgi:hypothetical protein